MALILKKTLETYHYYEGTYAHPRTRNWALVESPLPLLAILTAYLYFCTNIGPQIMKDRKPFKLKKTLIVYNIVQICFNAYLFYEGGVNAWFSRYDYKCQPQDYSNDPRDVRFSEIVWWYYICKITELLDTVFFVLRKKDKQISSLHIYHHTIMAMAAWAASKFTPGGHATFLGWINTLIHAIMYSYYLLAGLGPQFKKYLWWKKYLTLIQLIQFVFIFWHNFSVLFRDCNYPKAYNIVCTIEALIFILMFGNFYYQNYANDHKKEMRKEKKHIN